jgi:hypothetical protein
MGQYSIDGITNKSCYWKDGTLINVNIEGAGHSVVNAIETGQDGAFYVAGAYIAQEGYGRAYYYKDGARTDIEVSKTMDTLVVVAMKIVEE